MYRNGSVNQMDGWIDRWMDHGIDGYSSGRLIPCFFVYDMRSVPHINKTNAMF
jgi:hypothetical protein